MDELKELANYCLNCSQKPCSQKGCPMKTNIPEFINEIKKDNYKKAYEILINNNIFSHICSIVCPQEEQCEGSCIRGIKEKSTEIGKLERFVNEYADKNNYEPNFEVKERNGKKVAIIGAGPAGLECAFELLKNGFEVDIYDKYSIPGGVLVYGIPDFRLSRNIIEKLIKRIQNLGANIKNNINFGIDISLEELRKEYDAIFLAIGVAKSSNYKLSEKKLKNVYDSNVFLELYNENKYINDLGTVAVIGGGNVAMDSARVAIKMGAEKVKILYRRDKAHMPAREIELEDALKDGVEFKELVRVISANDKDEKIESLNCIRTEIIDGKAVDVKNNEFIEEADTVVFAIGLKPEKDVIEKQGIKLNEWGYIETNENGQTNIKNVFAGGDCIGEKATVCWALASGKRAAMGIIEFFKE